MVTNLYGRTTSLILLIPVPSYLRLGLLTIIIQGVLNGSLFLASGASEQTGVTVIQPDKTNPDTSQSEATKDTNSQSEGLKEATPLEQPLEAGTSDS